MDTEIPRRLTFLPLDRLQELEAKLRADAGVEACISCGNVLEVSNVAILRCGHLFCKTCVEEDRNVARSQRTCPICLERFRSMYIISERGNLVRWSIDSDREKSIGREARREKEKEKICAVQ
jgi:hypothetical protein